MYSSSIQDKRHSLCITRAPSYRPALVTDRSYKYRSQGTVRWAPPFGARAALGSGIYLSYNPMAAGLYPLTPRHHSHLESLEPPPDSRTVPLPPRVASQQNRPLDSSNYSNKAKKVLALCHEQTPFIQALYRNQKHVSQFETSPVTH